MGDSDEALGSWLQPGPALAVVAIWGVSQQRDDLYLSFSLSLCHSDKTNIWEKRDTERLLLVHSTKEAAARNQKLQPGLSCR